jgi:ferredoxin
MNTPAETASITRVWIAPGCIVCNLCEDTCPEVFDVQEETCVIRPVAEKHYITHDRQIRQAADECPVDVIRVQGHNEPG